MRNCQSCGAPLAEGATHCSQCGALNHDKVRPASSNVEMSKNAWAVTSASIAALLLLLSIITAFVDSATFINRMYTTAIEWNLPLACIAAIALGFIAAHKEGKKPLLSYASVVVLFVAFCFSNPTKNKIQDLVGNADNIVSVVAEGVSDNASSIGDWLDLAEDAAKDLEEEYDDYLEAKRRAEMKKYGYELNYDDCDIDYEDVVYQE